MNTRSRSAASDIAYLREMAEAGAAAPLLGGRFMILWGGLTGTVLIVHWLVITGVLALGASALWPLWLGYIVTGSLGSAILGRTIRNKPGAGSMGNRVQSVMWPVLGGGILFYYAGLTVGMLAGIVDAVFINTMLPVALLVYGTGWTIDALLSRQKTLLVPAFITLIACLACAVLVMTHWVYLVAAGAMLLGTFVPGFFLMAREPRELV
ncbi:MAG: hypothetical protein JJU26_06770 [Oceanicaulis sp.]|uniref:hypothetical protein n=1 Tax=Glycocaulis sp. TaxID=1969725 RepID=UPI0025C2D5F2|nr:hypothetical protein [Glycocaulis sp.]MCC5981408.1 hypothetical protein [Oceanicaulis sp.]MCH8521766.1 hypothetical protein [Glycocaulis sp.]